MPYRRPDHIQQSVKSARVVKLVDTPDLKSDAYRKGHAGSTPVLGTNNSQLQGTSIVWTKEKVETTVIDVVAEQTATERSKVTSDSTTIDLGMDSLDKIELVMTLEDEFNIQVEDEEAAKWTTVGMMQAYIAGRLVKAQV